MSGPADFLAELDPEVVASYLMMKKLEDGRVVGIHRLFYHWTMHVDIHAVGYEDSFCYETLGGVLRAFTEWNGDGEPTGWHRNPKTGRRRDPATGREWVQP